MRKIILISGLALLLPGIVFAQKIQDGGGIIDVIGTLVQDVTPIIVALALLYFFWGLAKYILAAGDETAQADGKKIMIGGIIALFVIVSVWGLVQVLNTTFGINQDDLQTSQIPSVDTTPR